MVSILKVIYAKEIKLMFFQAFNVYTFNLEAVGVLPYFLHYFHCIVLPILAQIWASCVTAVKFLGWGESKHYKLLYATLKNKTPELTLEEPLTTAALSLLGHSSVTHSFLFFFFFDISFPFALLNNASQNILAVFNGVINHFTDKIHSRLRHQIGKQL